MIPDTGALPPRFLVLGISKGNTQSTAFASQDFDGVGFKGVRDRLLLALKAVGLLEGETLERFYKRFLASEPDYAFASVVRCSLSGFSEKKQVFSADSPIVVPAYKAGSDGQTFVSACVSQPLLVFEERTRVCILLGNSDQGETIARGL